MNKICIVLTMFAFSCLAQKAQNGSTSDELAVKETVTGFLKWYSKNYPIISSTVLVPASLDENLNNRYYVSKDSLDKYLNNLTSSGYLSENFISSLRKYVASCDKEIQAKNQTDGPPEGLGFDLVLLTNDVNESIQKIDKGFHFSSLSVTNSRSLAEVELSYFLSFELRRVGEKWQIWRIFVPEQSNRMPGN